VDQIVLLVNLDLDGLLVVKADLLPDIPSSPTVYSKSNTLSPRLSSETSSASASKYFTVHQHHHYQHYQQQKIQQIQQTQQIHNF